MEQFSGPAPGAPGVRPTWAASDKSGVGTSLSAQSPVWFTLNRGVLTEVFYPRVDEGAVKDMGFIVTGGAAFFSEERRDAESTVTYPEPGVPAYRLVNTCRRGRYRIEKEIVSDPARPVVLQRARFVPLAGAASRYRLFVLLSPHLGNRGWGNTASVGEYKGLPMLFAEGGGAALALASSADWACRTAGFSGVSDGYADLRANGRFTALYDRAEYGDVALAGEIALPAEGEWFTLALGFGQTAAEAAMCARASLADGFEAVRKSYVSEWREWQAGLRRPAGGDELFHLSAAVMRCHEEKRLGGGIIASLSAPWGFSRSDDDLSGYHLVWTRDLVETAGGLLAAGARDDARRVLCFLRSTQEADGRWPQNMWLDGTAYWPGIQMDEVGFPILLVDLCRRKGELPAEEAAGFWPMARKAAGYIARNGPVTQQDRWEEDAGYSPFTLAVEIAALLVAAEMAEKQNEPATAAYLRETADIWNSHVERWTYAEGTGLARRCGVDGYYVRIAPPDAAEAGSPGKGFVPIKNRPPGSSREPARAVVSPDALALVRFGLRAPDDPRILNTVKVIDALLKADLPPGPAWYRYNDDGYGEHEDGSPFDGAGIGRPWPLITGERAHYELAAGRQAEAAKLRRALEGFMGDGRLIPEQVWDAAAVPERGLYPGRPSGSAMPLVWAHAEYVKLRRSLEDGAVFDAPPQTKERYVVRRSTRAPYSIWRFNHKCRSAAPGGTLRVELLAPAVVHWSADGWKTERDTATRDTGMGVFLADLPLAGLRSGAKVLFTFYWPLEGRWEGSDFGVDVGAGMERTAPAEPARPGTGRRRV